MWTYRNTGMAKSVFPHADALLFVEGRVRFRLPNGEIVNSGTAPSVRLAYGQGNAQALRNGGTVSQS